MLYILGLLPLLTIFISVAIYRYTGRKQFFKLDLVQFFYTFVLSIVIYVWFKSFLFVLLKSQLNLALDVNQIFLVDTMFSVLFIFLYAFLVIHTLTKTFHLHREQDPLLDLFHLSEYFHMDFSHFPIYIGLMSIFSVISLANLFIPLQVEVPGLNIILVAVVGFITGVTAFVGVMLYESSQPFFLRIMKLMGGLVFIVHVIGYYLVEPAFDIAHLVYWNITSGFFAFVLVAFFAERPEEKGMFDDRLPFKLNWKKTMYYLRYVRYVVLKKRDQITKS